ncbi:S-adenosyl-L-methionine-dependent methyltransferase [Xylaria flabelliformis]|nr:S-adenosyl-L-methionine-dependent methyltransferase [Xylaria flabelliformis]
MAQYDEYGALYTHLKNRPIPFMQNRYASEEMGDLTGLRVLDGACGTGFYSQMMARKGAAEVIGIDISPGMIDHAKEELPSQLRDNIIRYFVGDFEREDLLPSLGLGDMRGTFDVVFAAWLLNYAADWRHMSRMLANIFDAMKPGGRLICLTPNPFLLTQHGPEMADGERRIGDSWHVTETYDYGFKVRMIVNASPRVEFDSYVLYESEYNKAVEAVGLSNLSWKIGTYFHLICKLAPTR